MKKILLTVVSIIIVIGTIFGIMVYKEVKVKIKAQDVIEQIMQNEIEPKDIDYTSLGKYGDSIKAFAEATTKFNTELMTIDSEVEKYKDVMFLDKKYMVNPEEGKEEFNYFLNLILGYEDMISKHLKEIKECIKETPLTDKHKEEIYKDFDEANTEALVELIRPLAASLEPLKSTFNDFYDFLISRKGKYTVGESNISFDSAQDIEKYNKLVGAILEASKNVGNK